MKQCWGCHQENLPTARAAPCDRPYGQFCSWSCHDWAWVVIWLCMAWWGMSPRQLFDAFWVWQ